MGWLTSYPSLKGRYCGKRDIQLRFQFDFRDSRNYSYMAYQESEDWRLVHHGTYKLKHFAAVSKVRHPRHEITFMPSHLEVVPQPLAIRILESRDLPATKVVEYEVTWPTRSEDPYILFVPTGKSHADRDSWMIRAVS